MKSKFSKLPKIMCDTKMIKRLKFTKELTYNSSKVRFLFKMSRKLGGFYCIVKPNWLARIIYRQYLLPPIFALNLGELLDILAGLSIEDKVSSISLIIKM